VRIRSTSARWAQPPVDERNPFLGRAAELVWPVPLAPVPAGGPRRILIGYLGTGRLPSPQGTAFPSIAPYQVLRTRDGGLMIAAANDRLFAALCEVVERPELVSDPRFATNPERVANRAALAAELEEALGEEDRAVWVERLVAARVPAAPVATMADIAADEQTAALGILQELGPFTLVAPPVWLDGERLEHAAEPPPLGAHTREVLGEAGYSEAEVANLVAAGIAGAA